MHRNNRDTRTRQAIRRVIHEQLESSQGVFVDQEVADIVHNVVVLKDVDSEIANLGRDIVNGPSCQRYPSGYELGSDNWIKLERFLCERLNCGVVTFDTWFGVYLGYGPNINNALDSELLVIQTITSISLL